MPSKSSLRIGNISAATGDYPHTMAHMAKVGGVDAIVGDWLSEMNIAWNAITKRDDANLGYEAGFLTELEESLDVIVAKGIKVVSNAGALNTPALARKVEELCRSKGHNDLVIAYVVGDDISHIVTDSCGNLGLKFPHLDHGEHLLLKDWKLEPHCGNAYIGGWGIVAALDRGADIVLCGRVTDATPVVALAAWWYKWKEDDFDKLAGALVAGHIIECGTAVTGGNFSGFKDILPSLINLGFPIAEILPSGSCLITKPKNSGGIVSKFTVRTQLLYELQGEIYLNPDVAVDLSKLRIEDTDQPDCVFVSGAVGLPPPPTTKAMVAAPGGFQAEATFYINGLDVAEKTQLLKNQLNHALTGNKFSKLNFDLYGCQVANPSSQQSGTLQLRVFAQARRKEDISTDKFKTPVYAVRLQCYPGYHMGLDFRTMEPKPFMEIFPAIIPYDAINHQVILPDQTVDIPAPKTTAVYPLTRPSYETPRPVDLATFGPTKQAPLGTIVHARSGDKANNSSIGFFVRYDDEFPWLQSLLTVTRLKQLFADDWKNGDTTRRVERCEFPNLLAIHFRVLDFLDGGIASSSRVDGLGKGIGEYLRSKYVDVPLKFLSRGLI